MFAVKGWAVDASSLKPQTEPFKTTAAKSQPGQEEQDKSRKRKRGNADALANEDVGKLWAKHVEGIKSAPTKKRSKKERKRQRIEDDHEAEPGQPGKQDDVQQPLTDVASTSTRPGKKSKNVAEDGKGLNGRKSGSGTSEPAEKAPKTTANKEIAPKPQLPIASKLTPMQAAMRQKLVSARFRHLNETLYTAPSGQALQMFGENPEMFEDYHAGFRQQVSIWPENPVDKFISAIRDRGNVRLPSQKRAFKDKKGRGKVAESEAAPSGHVPPLPRTHGTCIISDLGCGDARLAQTLKDAGDITKLNLRILSYDLHSPCPLVTKADVSNLPAADGSVDVAIFCLALMGTNWVSFIEEAYRILHWKGELWVAEIKSRFGRVSRAGKPVEHSIGGKRKQAALQKIKESKRKEQDEVNEQETLETQVDGVDTKAAETDVTSFVDVLSRRGFVLKNGESSVDLSNKMFVKMEFVKAATPTKGKGVPPATARDPSRPKPKAKFLDDVTEDPAIEDETKTLKPSLYKVR